MRESISGTEGLRAGDESNSRGSNTGEIFKIDSK